MKKVINPTGEQTLQIKANEEINLWLEDLGPGSREYQLTVELLGENARCSISGRVHSEGKDQKNWSIQQIFRGKSQTASIDVRGVAEGNSRIQVDGAATLTQTSRDADANISEKVILFDQGKAKLLPVLRVETDAVKAASHGASVAPVEYEKLLYLQARQIEKTNAKDILKTGFLK